MYIHPHTSPTSLTVSPRDVAGAFPAGRVAGGGFLEQKTMTAPICFDSEGQYRSWREAAITAKEFCTPCTDCTKDYEQKMLAVDRCKRKYVETFYVIYPKKLILAESANLVLGVTP